MAFWQDESQHEVDAHPSPGLLLFAQPAGYFALHFYKFICSLDKYHLQ